MLTRFSYRQSLSVSYLNRRTPREENQPAMPSLKHKINSPQARKFNQEPFITHQHVSNCSFSYQLIHSLIILIPKKQTVNLITHPAFYEMTREGRTYAPSKLNNKILLFKFILLPSHHLAKKGADAFAASL